MGIIGKMFGKANNQQEQRKAEDKRRYDELLRGGMRPSEALHRINDERNRAREKTNQQQPQQKPKSQLQKVAAKVIAVDRGGRRLGQHIKESGFLTPPRNASESFLDFSRVQGGGGSLLDFSKVRNESMFGGGGGKRHKKAKKYKKQKSNNKEIVLRISR